MKKEIKISERLKKKYHRCEEVTNFKEMLERSATIYKTRIAFKLKDKKGNIYVKTYEEFYQDVKALGTYLIEKGYLGKRIAVIGKNSYKWSISYLAASIIGVVVPIDKELHANDIINFMNVSETVCILGDTKNLKSIREQQEKLNNKETNFIYLDEIEKNLKEGRGQLGKGNTKFEDIKINPDEM